MVKESSEIHTELTIKKKVSHLGGVTMHDVMIQIVSDNSDIELPSYQSEYASGMDVRSSADIVIAPGKICLVPTGLRVSIPAGYEIQVRARSGLALKHGIFVVNGPGTVDADYRGYIGVILGNFSESEFVIKRGDRIAQLVVQSVVHAKWSVVSELDSTARDIGGFGHSGTH